MRREEKRRKFHEAVLDTLYPPPSPPPAMDEEKQPGHESKDFNVELINLDDLVRSGTSSGGEGSESETQKLTRAQRKRLRKKKLMEDASRRGKIIGPLLPPTNEEVEDDNVRQNAYEKCAVTCNEPGEVAACSNQNKVKHRRMAKRVAKERLKVSGAKNCQSFESSDITDQKMNFPNMEN